MKGSGREWLPLPFCRHAAKKNAARKSNLAQLQLGGLCSWRAALRETTLRIAASLCSGGGTALCGSLLFGNGYRGFGHSLCDRLRAFDELPFGILALNGLCRRGLGRQSLGCGCRGCSKRERGNTRKDY